MIRAFRSTLEDLNERRSMHSLHSLRSARTELQGRLASGQSLHNSNILRPNQNKQQQHHSHGQTSGSISMLPPDISYIDEDPQTPRAFHNGIVTQPTSISRNLDCPTSALNPRLSDVADILRHKMRNNIDKSYLDEQHETRI